MCVLRTLNKCLLRESPTVGQTSSRVHIYITDMNVSLFVTSCKITKNSTPIKDLFGSLTKYTSIIYLFFFFRNLEELSKSVVRHKFHNNNRIIIYLFYFILFLFSFFRPPFWDLLMLQLLRPNSSNLPCLYSTFHLEYPLVLSRFCFWGGGGG